MLVIYMFKEYVVSMIQYMFGVLHSQYACGIGGLFYCQHIQQQEDYVQKLNIEVISEAQSKMDGSLLLFLPKLTG